jgi:hypothetical protein
MIDFGRRDQSYRCQEHHLGRRHTHVLYPIGSTLKAFTTWRIGQAKLPPFLVVQYVASLEDISDTQWPNNFKLWAKSMTRGSYGMSIFEVVVDFFGFDPL